MVSIDTLRASDGSGNASVPTVQSPRSAMATTLVVDTVQGINGKFHATMGTPHTFVDPVTSETITVISEATAVDFQGHVDGTNLEIDTIAPGFTDAGSSVNDIVIIKPTTQWADEVAEVLEVSHNDNGTLKDDAVDTGQLVDDSITTAKIADGAVTPAKRSGGFKIGTFTGQAGSGNQSITGVGFRPKFVLLLDGMPSTSNAVGAIGGMDENGNQFLKNWAARNSFTARASFSTTACIGWNSVNGGGTYASDSLGSYSSMDSDGFTVNWSIPNNVVTYCYIAYG